MEPLTIAAVIAGITGLSVAILTHIKHSECWCFKLDTPASSDLNPETQHHTTPTPELEQVKSLYQKPTKNKM